jgi:hypothetical protein
VFELQVNPSADLSSAIVVVNGYPLDISWRDSPLAQDHTILDIPDSTGTLHSVELSWVGTIDTPPRSLSNDNDVTQNIYFTATPVLGPDDPIVYLTGFALIMRSESHDPLVGLIPDFSSQTIDFEQLDSDSLPGSPMFENGVYDSDSPSDSDDFDIAAELESLNLLQNKAHEIQIQITATKQAIAANLKLEREKLCLKHLIKECDGIICAAKAIAQRLCDKIGIATEESFQYAHIKSHHIQDMMTFDEKVNPKKFDPNRDPWPTNTHRKVNTKKFNLNGHSMTSNFHHDEANMPLMLTKNVSEYAFKPIDLVNPPNPLVRALQIIAAVLSLSALFAFLKRRCMSMRKRVERAADLEQRRNERAYRRAARRALMRKRWENFLNAVNCFGRKEKAGIEDYEEKRALILQDAFLEQDLDQAEKGEIMEAEIRELRYAHEIVSSLVRVDERRYDLVTPVNDPPPPLVPLPQTPGPRSRASTYTLPSYTSETLPDYSSQLEDSDGSDSLVNGYTPSTSDERGRRPLVSPISQSSSSSARTRYTPTSSIRETSPRPSEETLRTGPSRPSRDLRRD